MAKEKVTPQDADDKEGFKVEPSPLHVDTTPSTYAFEPLSGEYHLVRLDANNKEIIGSDFSVGAKTYRTSY